MKAKVIMLETTDKSRICHLTKKGKEFNDLRLLDKEVPVILDSINYHFYLIDESAEIKEDDWFIKDSLVTQCNEVTGNELGCVPNNEVFCNIQTYFDKRNCSKIIASTDKLIIDVSTYGKSVVPPIYLPQLSEQSIQLLIDYYNQYGKMPDEVELQDELDCENCHYKYYCSQLQCGLNFPDYCNSVGTVDITIPEENIILQIVTKAFKHAAAYGGFESRGYYGKSIEDYSKDWIKENLK